MTELNQEQLDALQELREHFEHSLENVQRILNNKSNLEEVDSEIGYIIHDNTSYDGGYQNGSVVKALNILHDLQTQMEDEPEEESSTIFSNQYVMESLN